MNEPTKTLAFLGSAVALVGAAVASHFATQPKTNADFELLGKPFFPDFTSTEAAASLEVSALDTDSLTPQRFKVQNQNGLWRIPSHHDYPAEAAARLAETSASVMGIEREALVGRLTSEHERLGVIDPLGSDEKMLEDPEAVGKRITLKNDSGEVLVDFIIGKEAGEVAPNSTDPRLTGSAEPAKYYYVRAADEQQTYKAKLNLDLSTKFSDWIDPDLLRLDRTKLSRMEIDNYQLSEERNNPLGQVRSLTKVQGDQLTLSRPTSTEPWGLKDLKTETEELQASQVNDIVNTLTELKISGVRPKVKYEGKLLLTPDLKLNQELQNVANPKALQAAILQMQDELEERGFSLAGTQQKLELVSSSGELAVGTSEGLLYTLQFGKEVEGEDKAIEIGDGTQPVSTANAAVDSKLADNKDADAAETRTDSNDASEGENAAEQTTEEKLSDKKSGDDESSDDNGETKNRYLMIRVSFDESLLGEKPEKPTEPVAPTKPDGYVAASESADEKSADEKSADEKSADEKLDSDAPPSPASQGGEKNPNDSSDEPQESKRQPEFIQYDEQLAAYEEAKVEYELAVARFDQATTEFESRVAEGKKLVDEMNQRFSDWYYVINAANLKTLQSKRADLVKPLEAPESEPAELEQPLPNMPDISFPKE